MQSHRSNAAVATGRAMSIALSIALTAAPLAARVERGVAPTHQPLVERSDFIFDVMAGAGGTFDPAEARRLAAWFEALGLRYGDRVTIVGVEGYGLAGMRNGIADLVARHGLLTGEEAPITVGSPPVGAVRVVVSRSRASVPGCPSWRDHSETDFVGGLSSNYGCASASNLAAMIADPHDLLEGRKTNTDLRALTSSKAIQVYRDKALTGAGGLQVMSAGGK